MQPDAPTRSSISEEQIIHGWPETRLRHEFMHLTWRINRRNYPSFLITEGFTEYLNRRAQPERWHRPAAQVAQTRGLPKLAEMERIDIYRHDLWAFDLVSVHGVSGGSGRLGEVSGLLEARPESRTGHARLFRRSADGAEVPVGRRPEAAHRDRVRGLADIPGGNSGPGLFADGVRMLEGRTDLSPLGRRILAQVLAGDDRPADALAAIRDFTDRPETLRAALPDQAWADGLLLAGQLWDVAGERDRARRFTTPPRSCPTVRMPCGPPRISTARRPAGPSTFASSRRQTRWTAPSAWSGSGSRPACRATTWPLPSTGVWTKKIERLNRNLGLAPQLQQDTVREYLTGKNSEDCVRLVLAAGVHPRCQGDVWIGTVRRFGFPPAAAGRR